VVLTSVLAATMAAAASPALASQPKFEPEGGTFPISLAGTGGEGKLETVPEGTNVRVVQWSANTLAGEYNSATTLRNVQMRFTGSTATGPFGVKISCSSPGAAAGEIVTKPLLGTLVYLVAGKNEVGIDLKPQSGTVFAELTCGGVQKFVFTGSVVGRLTPVNTLTSSFVLTFGQSAGKQAPEGYLAPSGCAFVKDVLAVTGTAVGFGGESFGPIQTGFQTSESLIMSEKIKVAATSCT